MQNFYLIRHGETDWNVKYAKLQGHTDIPLNEKGIRQAQALADLTAHLKISRVISSDLQRALRTAEHLAGAGHDQGHEIRTDRNLREVHLGVGEGLNWDQVSEKLGADFRVQWSSNTETYADLRFPQGESRREVLDRVQTCLKNYLEQFPNETLAFVSHGFVIRTLVYHLSPIETHFFVPNCAVVPFAFTEGRLIYTGPDLPEELLQPRLRD